MNKWILYKVFLSQYRILLTNESCSWTNNDVVLADVLVINEFVSLHSMLMRDETHFPNIYISWEWILYKLFTGKKTKASLISWIHYFFFLLNSSQSSPQRHGINVIQNWKSERKMKAEKKVEEERNKEHTIRIKWK